MITLLGIIIFTIPFALLIFFKDKVVGFFSILTASLLFHFLIALITQSLSLFRYEVVIPIYLIASLTILVFVYLKHLHKKHYLISLSSLIPKRLNRNKTVGWANNSVVKQNFLVVIAVIIILFNLLSVHYNFTGTVNSYHGSYEVENSSNIYPYFSDEWVAIAFVDRTMDSHSLPVINPLTENERFRNPLVPYFSFLSDIFLFFNLDPLEDFEFVNLLVGMFTCITFFVLLMMIGIDKRVSVITTLIVPYITNGGNLPGIWFLIPMTFALPFYLISLIGFAKKDNRLLILSSLLTILLYPPFIAFVLPVSLALIFRNKGVKIKTSISIIGILFLAVAIIIPIVISDFKLFKILETLQFYLFRTNLVGGYLSFPIWFVLPVFVLPLALLGLFLAIKKRLYYLILSVFVGLTYWLLYVEAERVFIIDFPRIVIITSFLILILFGIALNYLVNKFINEKYKNIITIMCIFIALKLSFTYTENDSWRNLKLHFNRDSAEVMLRPAPTSSVFLTDEDLLFFNNFTKKRFISPPWKGLVISAATGNYPLATKPSTVGVFTLNYDDFMGLNCKEKDRVSFKNKIDYVYSEEFDCPRFTREHSDTESSEGLGLYKFNKNE